MNHQLMLLIMVSITVVNFIIKYVDLIWFDLLFSLETIGYSRSSLPEGIHTHIQIKYSYIYTDTIHNKQLN